MSTIHSSWIKAGGIALEIMEGKHDDDLDYIAQACKQRLKMRFRKGQKVKLVGTRNVALEGTIATITKVNVKTITVGIGEPDQFGYPEYYNVPAKMLEAV